MVSNIRQEQKLYKVEGSVEGLHVSAGILNIGNVLNFHVLSKKSTTLACEVIKDAFSCDTAY